MIFDNLKNIQNYKGIHKNLDIAIDWLVNNNYKDFDGERLVINDDIYLLHNNFPAANVENLICEIHHNYMDIHLFSDDQELVFFDADFKYENDQVMQEYDSTKDVMFIKSDSQKTPNHLELTKDSFVMFMKNEVHCPRTNFVGNSKEKLHKYIMKIKL